MASQMHVLLVEDSPTDTLLTIHALQESGVDSVVYGVEDGVDAIAFLKKEGKFGEAPRPDVILLDLNLPKKDGMEVLKFMKGSSLLSSIPVAVLTVSDEMNDIVASYRLEAVSFMTKPVYPGDLKSLFEHIKK